MIVHCNISGVTDAILIQPNEESIMYQTPEQFVAFSKANIDAAIHFANIAFDSTERLLDLQLRAAKDALEQGASSARAMSGARDFQQVFAAQSTAAQPGLDKAVAFSRECYGLATRTQEEIGRAHV